MKSLRINDISLVIDNDDRANAALTEYLNTHAINNMKFVLVIAFMYSIVSAYAYFLSKNSS